MGLNSSPLGLAAYILEKFSTATDPAGRNAADGLLPGNWNMDDLLTNVMVYWATGSMTSAQRFYKENLKFEEERIIMDR